MSTGHIIAVHTPRDAGWIAPGSEQHARMLSPSKVAAILGFSRWESPFGLWMRMKGLVDPDPPKDIYDMGHDCEPTAAARWRRHNPDWLLSPTEVQFVVDPSHFGFPAVATPDRRGVHGRDRRAVEFKIARDLEDLAKWGDDLSGECPEDYATQVVAQMLFTGMTRFDGHLLALGPFWQERIYPIAWDPSVAAWMIGKLQAFWASLSATTPPPLDDSVATYQTVRKLHPDIAADTTTQLDPDLAADFLSAVADNKNAETRLRGLKSRVLDAMGDAEAALVGKVLVAKRAPHASGSVALNTARKTTAEDIRTAAAAEPSALERTPA